MEALKILLFRDADIPAKSRVAREQHNQEDNPPHEIIFSRPSNQYKHYFGISLDRQIGPRHRKTFQPSDRRRTSYENRDTIIESQFEEEIGADKSSNH